MKELTYIAPKYVDLGLNLRSKKLSLCTTLGRVIGIDKQPLRVKSSVGQSNYNSKGSYSPSGWDHFDRNLLQEFLIVRGYI